MPPTLGDRATSASGDEVSLLAFANTLLRRRRVVGTFACLGLALGIALSFRGDLEYVSEGTLIPQSAETGSSAGLALAAANQLGLRVPSTGAWTAAMYTELMRSHSLLLPMVNDTLVVPELGNRRVALMDLLEVQGTTPAARLDNAASVLAGLVKAEEDKKIGAVRFAVATRWASVSQALANRLIQRVNDFNIETRRTQASAERRFVDAQVHDAEQALRRAEDNLQGFLQQNRDGGASPQLTFERERLQRELTLRMQLYTLWMQSSEDARARELRDTPVVTVLEQPRITKLQGGRRVLRKVVFGLVGGTLLGVMIALIAQAVGGARDSQNRDVLEFMQLARDMMPRVLRRGRA